MSLLALDISTKTGWSKFVDGQPVLFGVIVNDLDWNTWPYPQNFIEVTDVMIRRIIAQIDELQDVDTIIIEETNKTGRFGSRHSQKILEFLHCELNRRLLLTHSHITVRYVNTSDWRKTLKLSVAETKKLAKPYLKKLDTMKKELAKTTDREAKKLLKTQLDLFKQELKDKCILHKIDKKSISVAYANATFNLNLKKGDNDISDSLCLGKAFLLGASFLTNKDIFDRGAKK